MAITSNMPSRNIKGNVKAQDKILYVANKLGLSSLKYMQATTRCIYDVVSYAAGSPSVTLFENAQSRNFPQTNISTSGNRFEVNEALLVEKIAFFTLDDLGQNVGNMNNFDGATSVKFDLIIGNKTVMKDLVMESNGEQAFYASGTGASSQINLEGVGILIPPQVEFKVVAMAFNTDARTATTLETNLGCYLYGTGVLLNFNTSI